MFPYAKLPAIRSFCLARLEAAHHAGEAEAPELRARLENAVHALRALEPDTWWQAEEDIRDIAVRFATDPDYPALGLTGRA
ncbi:hypothetical protein ACIBL3_31395 [Kribbella sp. NPDC050124]|uniref:hypothetical protein n=1 Tax=Kribbella sp. NPDC050124 TaxID=3364114 RepID=UPI0037A7527F